jgi:drug/metabolite transporter (DMT)-like permease
MTAALFGLMAALANAAQALISKELTTRAPARQLIGALYVCNALVLLPLAPFVDWRWTPEIVALHLVSVALMALTAICVWDLLDHGAASATTTATAMSPIPAAIAAAVLLPEAIGPLQVVAAIVVVCGVLLALSDAFTGLGRRGTVWRIVGAAAGTGLLTVASRLLGDAGAGVVETYVVRTAIAALLFVTIIPPRDVPRADIPRLFGRSLVVTTYFVLVILGAQQGNPVVVQTFIATTPLWVIVVESIRGRMRPPRRTVGAAGIVIAGVLVTLGG